MSAEEVISLVQRKARTGRDAHAARAMSLGRALRLTAAKQADHLMGLPLSVLGVTRKKQTTSQIPNALGPGKLTLLLDGPNGQVGAAVLDPVLAAGLIQQQTMGKVLPVQENASERRHTATDAAMCAPLIEALLTRAALLPDEEADRAILQGYRFGVWAETPRQAALVLDAIDYEIIEMTLDLAAGVRAGTLMLVLPMPVPMPADVPEGEASEENPAQQPRGSKQTLSNNVLGLKADLMIALAKISCPLNRVTGFTVGEVVNLDISSMSEAMVLDAGGRIISRGTLGQIDGMRALQVKHRDTAERTEPRRRESDHEDLDLPDVTAPRSSDQATAPQIFQQIPRAVDVPQLSDLDIFGDMGALPDMPDMEEAARAADARMQPWDEDDTGSGSGSAAGLSERAG